MLRQARWDPADKSQVLTEFTVKQASGLVSEEDGFAGIIHSDGDDMPTGRADYVLLDQRGRPLAVVEAKRTAIQPYTAKQQVLPYAKSIGAPFIFLTTAR